jgi:hypothetical protein
MQHNIVRVEKRRSPYTDKEFNVIVVERRIRADQHVMPEEINSVSQQPPMKELLAQIEQEKITRRKESISTTRLY